ncbi:MAG: hypothetical protein M1819_003556 [Sarea resinae]|nr:MAG: hypothetical protein M1819_003556 [Sarea resinae]
MADGRVASISPMTRSPVSESPNGTAIDGEANHAGHKAAAFASPLSTEQPITGDGATNGDVPRPATAGSVQFAAGTIISPSPKPDSFTGREPSRPGSMDGAAESVKGKANATGNTTPQGRRSVQFVRRANTDNAELPDTSSRPWDLDDGEAQGKERKGSTLLSKLRALAGPSMLQSHGRSQSGFTIGSAFDEHIPNEPLSTASEGEELERAHTLGEEAYEGDDDADADADAEDSSGEGATDQSTSRRKRRRSRRPLDGGPQTAPTTPKTPLSPEGYHARNLSFTSTPSETHMSHYLRRRATMTDIPERQGVSEDEGRDRLGLESAWRRGSAWVHSGRGSSYVGSRQPGQESPEARRPSNIRRFTGFGSYAGAHDESPSPWRHRGERTSSVSAQKWRQLKAGLKMLGQRRKEENKIDNAKSAELLAELTAGVPAALILASTFQRDEHGHKKIPVLLEQLKLRVTDSKKTEFRTGDKHMIFRIELEYGSGLTRMRWVIHRALRDFANLHVRYKLQGSTEKYIQFKEDASRAKLPRFPRGAFPYLRGVRGLGSDEEDEETINEDQTGGGGSGPEKSGKRKKRRPSMKMKRRVSSFAGPQDGDITPGIAGAGQASGSLVTTGASKGSYPERQRKKLESYLQNMIRYLIFRADSNRLCKFLELSALGIRLAAEGGYHGKEGYLVIQSNKGLDFRRAWTPSLASRRHWPKWFLVRHSYVVCIDSPEEMNIYDVFLVDSDFSIQPKKKRLRDQKAKDIAKTAKDSAAHPQHHMLRLSNSERKLKLLAKNERQLYQFEESIKFMSSNTIWSRKNRFDSFAPVRTGVFAQWLVDGRDYMWNVSRAISMARDVIYIHDWWLSPELYMRRPAAISQKWRIDRLLQRKAQEGVKVFVIMYRNINSAIPIDSEYTKFSLLDLHPNVFVQRSPNQFRQNTFFWAHHEKICIVDHTVAFVGGIDLCFGRWDTPQHSVVDDKLTGFELSDVPKDADHCQLWPGKDYSNPRVQDFYALDKPYEEMYDRTKIPRMPWHDISMQIVGQPARDLTRHFVQRWNYILRQRKPTRPTPFLLPPPDFNPADLEALGLDGTCEIQILRSCCWWSMGTPDKTEHSIMNAYIKSIEQSEHFVYIENQFFVSSCEVEGTRIENLIGDALVERIVRAHRNIEDWRAVIVIPLMPGFQNTVDSQDGTSVRLIMQCQYRSICRGESSIFGRLRSQGIDPEDYIQFYSLRSWGKIGPKKQLVTEQLYIHAKCMVVDDRVAIIGSANINERSMLGSRDSECAAVVRDTDMLWSTMNGEPYLVGRFPHTLRMRLMREHLGLDVDEIMEEERREQAAQHGEHWEGGLDGTLDDDGISSAPDSPVSDKETEAKLLRSKHQLQDELLAKSEKMFSFNHDVDWEQENNPNLSSGKKVTEDSRVIGNNAHANDVDGLGADKMKDLEETGLTRGRDSAPVNTTHGFHEILKVRPAQDRNSVETPKSPKLTSPTRSGQVPEDKLDKGNANFPPPRLSRMTTQELGLPMLSQLPALPATDDTDIGGPPPQRSSSGAAGDFVNPLVADMKRPMVDPDCMRDPLNDSFFLDVWHQVAENNTRLYRQVFRCMPDNEVKTWKQYKEYAAYSERFAQAQGGGKNKKQAAQESQGRTGPPGASSVPEKLTTLGPIGEAEKKIEELGGKLLDKSPARKGTISPKMGRVQDWAEEAGKDHAERQLKMQEKQTSSSSPPRANGKAEIVDEKQAEKETTAVSQPPPAPTVSDEQLSEFPSLKFAIDEAGEAERGQRKNTIDSANFNTGAGTTSQRRRRRGTSRGSRREFQASDDVLDTRDAEDLMKMVQGHLVVWPYEWYVSKLFCFLLIKVLILVDDMFCVLGMCENGQS